MDSEVAFIFSYLLGVFRGANRAAQEVAYTRPYRFCRQKKHSTTIYHLYWERKLRMYVEEYLDPEPSIVDIQQSSELFSIQRLTKLSRVRASTMMSVLLIDIRLL